MANASSPGSLRQCDTHSCASASVYGFGKRSRRFFAMSGSFACRAMAASSPTRKGLILQRSSVSSITPLPLQRAPDGLGGRAAMRVVLVRHPRPEEALQAVTLVPRNHVHVQVRHRLADAVVVR